MSDWIKCSLCDIASYVTDRVNVLDLTIDTYISTENLVADRGGMIPATKLPNVNVVPSYQQNDILISNIRPYFKKIWLADSMGGCSNDVLVIRANTTCDSKYLYYLLSTDDFFDYATKSSKGTKMPRGDKKVIMHYPVILPPLPVQKKIAAILSSLDDKIEINTRMNKVLEETARTLFHRWFVEFEFPNDEGKPYKSSGGRMIASEMGEIPEGWRVGTLNEITEITMGQSPNGTSYNEQGIGVVFYQGRAEFGFRYPSRRLYTTEPKRMAKKGDVLMSVRAPVGDINLASELCCIGRGLAAIQSTDNHTSFIYYLMLHLQKTLDSFNGEGTVFGSINRSSIESLKVVLPPDSYLELFESIARSLDLFIEKNFMENQRLQLMRDSLLPKLMDCTLAVDPISSKNDIYEID